MSTTDPTDAAANFGIAGLSQAQPPSRFRLMDDEELADLFEVLTRELFVINADIDRDTKEGGPRGERWRFSASRAKAYREADLHLVGAEQAARRRPAPRLASITDALEDDAALQDAEDITAILDRAAQRGCLEMMRSMALAVPQDTAAISAMVAWRVQNGQESGLVWIDDRWQVPSIQGSMP